MVRRLCGCLGNGDFFIRLINEDLYDGAAKGEGEGGRNRDTAQRV